MQFVYVYVGTVSDHQPYAKTVKIYIQANAEANADNPFQDHYMLHMDEFGFAVIYDHISGTLEQAVERANEFIQRKGKFAGVNNSH